MLIFSDNIAYLFLCFYGTVPAQGTIQTPISSHIPDWSFVIFGFVR